MCVCVYSAFLRQHSHGLFVCVLTPTQDDVEHVCHACNYGRDVRRSIRRTVHRGECSLGLCMRAGPCRMVAAPADTIPICLSERVAQTDFTVVVNVSKCVAVSFAFEIAELDPIRHPI